MLIAPIAKSQAYGVACAGYAQSKICPPTHKSLILTDGSRAKNTTEYGPGHLRERLLQTA